MLSHLVLVSLLLAQEPPLAFAAPAAGITVSSDVHYGTSGATRLAMDVYKPAPGGAARKPALVFFNRATGADRSGRFYAAWARAAASQGVIGILPHLRSGSEAADFRVLMAYLEQHAAEHGIEAIAVYAGSGNVFSAFPAVEDPKQTAIKAAVMYYGAGPVTQFRVDLPVLYVRAGLDRPPVNESIAALAAVAVAQNPPVTLLNYAGGHHAFEMVDDNAATREVIDQTLEFVKRATSASYQDRLRGVRQAARQGAGVPRPWPAGRAGVRAEGGRGCGDRLAELDPRTVPAGVAGGGAGVRGDQESARFSGHLRAALISGVDGLEVGVE